MLVLGNFHPTNSNYLCSLHFCSTYPSVVCIFFDSLTKLWLSNAVVNYFLAYATFCLFRVYLLFLKNLKSAISGFSALSRANHLNIFFKRTAASSASVLMHTYHPRQPSSDSNVTRTNGESGFWQVQNVLILIKGLSMLWQQEWVRRVEKRAERESVRDTKKSQTGEKETGEKQVYFREVAIMLLGGEVGAINLRLDNGSSKTNFSCLEDSPTKSSVSGWYIALSKATALVLPWTVIFGS